MTITRMSSDMAELVYCELYAGGKYDNNSGGNYEYSLGLNGLGACATQYSSEYMKVTVFRDGYKYSLEFHKGENIGGLKKEKAKYAHSGTIQHWKPDLEVFTDIRIPLDYYRETLRRQAVVNPGITFVLEDEESGTTENFYYERGIVDYVSELANSPGLTEVQFYESFAKGRDREDKPEYKVKMQIAFMFHNEVNVLEYYHNSSFLEYGGAPDRSKKQRLFMSWINT